MYFVSLVMSNSLWQPWAVSPPGPSIHGISQARKLEIQFPTAGDLPDPGIKPASHISCIGRQVLYHLRSRDYRNEKIIDVVSLQMPGVKNTTEDTVSFKKFFNIL